MQASKLTYLDLLDAARVLANQNVPKPYMAHMTKVVFDDLTAHLAGMSTEDRLRILRNHDIHIIIIEP